MQPARTQDEAGQVEAAIAPLDATRDDEAGAILADATGAGTEDAGRSALAAARADPTASVYGATVDGALVAVYALRIDGPSAELTILAVAPGHRGRGHGRACLKNALARAGRRPLVVETDDDSRGFYARAGFKLIGKRRHPSGTVRYRLGWHAPRPDSIPSSTNLLHNLSIPAHRGDNAGEGTSSEKRGNG